MSATYKNGQSMTCAEFQETLPELFEEHADLTNDEHLKSCENCAALVRDLEYIAQQAKLLLPIHDPNPAVWDSIQNALKKEMAPEPQKASGSGVPRP